MLCLVLSFVYNLLSLNQLIVASPFRGVYRAIQHLLRFAIVSRVPDKMKSVLSRVAPT